MEQETTKFSIPTEYAGTRFRSRLESQWAEFFDIHRMQWDYEPEGFQIEAIRYLPDFYLPALRTVVEVKGILDATDEQKLRALAIEAAIADALVILAEPPVGAGYRTVMPSPAVFTAMLTAWNYAAGSRVTPQEFAPLFRTLVAGDALPIARQTAALVTCTVCGEWQFTEVGLPTDAGACRVKPCGYIDDYHLCFDKSHPQTPLRGQGLRFCPDCRMVDKP